jgi:hypothetical protein
MESVGENVKDNGSFQGPALRDLELFPVGRKNPNRISNVPHLKNLQPFAGGMHSLHRLSIRFRLISE